ncbi:hypothetical protein DID88_007277 [Monilinia fructigena]|uniref:Uncharacterized protein n=1 Tax=Monilinia fructigena TaxID=38457 RepID=A0A395J7T7_9HELO|nr:hypothetical protein DID88_007277 [Monilinia fructigena]
MALSKIQASRSSSSSSSSSPSSTLAHISSTSHNKSNPRPSGIGRLNMYKTLGRDRNNGYQFKEEGNSMESLSSTASTPGSGASMTEFSGVTTPSGSPGYGYDVIGDGYFDLTLDDEMISFDPCYAELHRQMEDRLKMEKQDAEYARSIANSHGFVPGTPVTSSKPSAFNKMLGVRPQAFSSPDDQAIVSSAMSSPYGSCDSSQRRTLPWKVHTANSNPDVKTERRIPSLAQSSNFALMVP